MQGACLTADQPNQLGSPGRPVLDVWARPSTLIVVNMQDLRHATFATPAYK